MNEYLIWWTSHDECRDIGDELPDAPYPNYIRSEYRSRLGRAGRGRLWVADHIELEKVDWDDEKPASRLAKERAGIVVHRRDAMNLFHLPGFLTDLQLNFINEREEI